MTNFVSLPVRMLSAVAVFSVLVFSFAVAPFAEASSCAMWSEQPTMNAVTLKWTVTGGVSSASINNGIGGVALSGSQYIGALSSDKTYVMTVVEYNGFTSTCETTVRVNNYGQQNSSIQPSCAISFQSNVQSGYQNIPSGTLTWSSSNATSATISPNMGSVAMNGSQVVYPTGINEYSMTVYGGSGTNVCRTNVTFAATPTSPNLSCAITAQPTSIQNDASSSLTWTSSGASRATLSDGIGNVNTNGSLTVRPEASRLYTLSVTDSQGRTNSCQVTVSVDGSYVKLTQIPHTGVSPLETAISWLIVTLFAGMGALLLVRTRGNIRRLFS